jgi:hypothetical protein
MQNTKYLIASTIRTTKRKILIYNQNKTHKEKIYFRFDVPKTESTLKPIMINNYIKAAEAAKIGINKPSKRNCILGFCEANC